MSFISAVVKDRDHDMTVPILYDDRSPLWVPHPVPISFVEVLTPPPARTMSPFFRWPVGTVNCIVGLYFDGDVTRRRRQKGTHVSINGTGSLRPTREEPLMVGCCRHWLRGAWHPPQCHRVPTTCQWGTRFNNEMTCPRCLRLCRWLRTTRSNSLSLGCCWPSR